MRINLDACDSVEAVEFAFKEMPVKLRYHVAPTKTLFFSGSVDKYPVTGFVYCGEEKWTLGGSVIQCDALGKNDYKEFLELLSKTVRYNGFRFDAAEKAVEKKKVKKASEAESVEAAMDESIKRKRGRPKKQPESV